MGVTYQRVRLLAPAVLLVLFGLLPRALEASCGDYVILTGGAARQALMGANLAHWRHGTIANQLPAPWLPCNGPHCSANRSLPAPAPVLTQPRTDVQGLPVAGADFTISETSSWTIDDASCQPLEVISSIFHPPRHSA